MSPKEHNIKFSLDENFPLPAGKFLRSKGYTVNKFPDRLRNKEFPDENVIKLTIKLGTVLLSTDEAILNNQNLVELIHKSPGLVFLMSGDPSLKHYQNLVIKMLATITPQQIAGKALKVTVSKTQYIQIKRS